MNPRFGQHGKIEFQGQPMHLLSRQREARGYLEGFLAEKRFQDSVMFNVESIGSFRKERTMSSISRTNQSYSRQVSFEFLGPHRLGNDYLDGVLETFPLPVGTSFGRDRGSWFGVGASRISSSLFLVFGMALLSVWMIVSGLLENWLDPMVIMLAVPLSAIGIMFGVMYHGLSFDRNAAAGALLAIGVVVNNAILLMHGKERVREAGVHGFRSWLHVYREKMRPVLITSITTLAGLMPLILIETSEFWNTLATVVSWGLATSTVFLVLLMGIWEKGEINVTFPQKISNLYPWHWWKKVRSFVQRRR